MTIHKIGGYLRIATITKVDLATMTTRISFNTNSATAPTVGKSDDKDVLAHFPVAFLSNGSGFIGGYPQVGTPVVVAPAEGGGHYYIVGFLPRDPAAKSTHAPKALKVPELAAGQIVIQTTSTNAINFYDDLQGKSILVGQPINGVTFDNTRRVLLNTFDYDYSVTQASRVVVGAIRRDKKPSNAFPSYLREISTQYDDTLKVIGMDPIADARNSASNITIRNPVRVEHRSVVYEYEEDALIQSNDKELSFYSTGKFNNNPQVVSRRQSRADALSLSLVSPNYLIEEIKGTVVDLYGNIVDLNRNVIQIGQKTTGTNQSQNSISISNISTTANESDPFKNVYEQIKRAERKSLAYHFEINARKETLGPPDVNDTSDFARARSRFFIDIDKEGQMKMNIPASSETGNIPLMTRYENYSTVYPNPNTNDPDDMVFNSNYQDILIEQFGSGVVSLQDDLGGNSAPTDRTQSSTTYIKLGTVYHDITSTLLSFGSDYNPASFEYAERSIIYNNQPTPINNVITTTIPTAGPNAKGGGRSASINLDGMLTLNIGANTVDRQSLWADLQGGAVVNMGRDLTNNVSLAAKADGYVLWEIGGSTPSKDSRFAESTTVWRQGVLDIRVYNSQKELTILRIDDNGLTITTPSQLNFFANQGMVFQSSGPMEILAPSLQINGRVVVEDPGKGDIR